MNTLFRTLFVLCILCLGVSSAFAATEYQGSVTLGRIYTIGGGHVAFGVTPVPAHTCNYYNSIQFNLDASTTDGKNMYTLLLFAKATGQTIDVWYEDTTAPNTNETNGCNNSTFSVIDFVGISN